MKSLKIQFSLDPLPIFKQTKKIVSINLLEQGLPPKENPNNPFENDPIKLKFNPTTEM